MRGFELVHPRSLDEALDFLDDDDPSVRPWSGGTALMLMMKAGVFQPSRLVCLAGVADGNAAVEETAQGGLRIGALATLTSLEHSAAVLRIAPVIARTMKRLSNVRVRNVARVGGNLAHGDPHMDLPPVLAALGAEIVVGGGEGERRIRVENLFSGYYETVLKRSELITEVLVPPQRGWCSAYVKCTTRSADDWPALGVAVSLKVDEGRVTNSRVAIGAATEKLTRLHSVETALAGAAAEDATFARGGEAAASEAITIDDARGSAEYKTALVRVYTRRALQQAIAHGAVQ